MQWDEKDKERGKTPPHRMGTDPKMARRPGSKRKEYQPIPHKEGEVISEEELLKALELGTLGGVVNIDHLVMDRFNSRIEKDFITQEFETWQALQGILEYHENDIHISETFPIQQFTPTVPWDELATSFPLVDLNACKLMFRGTGATAKGAKLYCNETTMNRILENRNPNDLRGFVVDNFRSAAFDLDQFNKMQVARGLPIWEPYDEGFDDENGTFKTFIPDGVGILVGKRPAGQTVGDYVTTPTIHRIENGKPAPGFFSFITVNGQPNSSTGTTGINLAQLGQAGNPKIEVFSGVYGGPRIIYPRSIIKMNLFEAA